MPVFSLDNGRLTPANPSISPDSDLTAEALMAVRDQVAELVNKLIFPVAWLTDTQGDRHTSLVALEPSGQTVTVEVVNSLDAAGLMACLARAGRYGDIPRGKLSGLYPRGAAAFRRDWQEFLDSCPQRVEVGPRLIVIAAEIADEVRTAVDSLLGAGVAVYRVSLHSTRAGVLLSLDEVQPHEQSFRHLAQAMRRGQLEASGGAPAEQEGTGDVAGENPIAEQVAQAGASVRAEGTSAAEGAARHATPEHVAAESLAGSAEPAETDESMEPAETDDSEVSTESAESAEGDGVEDSAGADTNRDADAGARDEESIEAAVGSGGVEQEPVESAQTALFPKVADHDWDPDGVRWPEREETAYEEEQRRLLAGIVDRHGEMEVRLRSRRRRVNAQATLRSGGVLVLADGHSFSDPDEAADHVAGRRMDGWKMWKRADGTSLGDLRMP